MVQISEVPNEEISYLTKQYVDKIHALNSDPYFRDAIVRFAVRELAWAMLERFDNQHELADQLRGMADAMDEHDAGEEEETVP